MTEKTNLGENLLKLRKGRGFSQEELADVLGVSRQAISKWERNEAYPDTENLIALSKLYGVSLDTLVYSETQAVAPSSSEGTYTADSTADTNTAADANDESVQSGKAQDNDDDDDDDDDDDEDENDPEVIASKKQFHLWYSLPYPIIITVVYLLWGFLLDGWWIGWTLYITIPVYYSVIDCIRRKRLTPFCYPVFATFLFCFFGMAYGIWHPLWVIYVTIPIFYSIASVIDRRK